MVNIFDGPIEYLGLFLGAVIAVLLGRTVKWVIGQSTAGIDLAPPKGVLDDTWKEVTDIPSESAGAWLGSLERLLFFAAIWFDVSAIIIGWLAFKVATKWEVWQNLIRVPKQLEKIDELSYLAARRRWASHVFMRFLVGTIGNLLASALAVFIARLIMMIAIEL